MYPGYLVEIGLAEFLDTLGLDLQNILRYIVRLS